MDLVEYLAQRISESPSDRTIRRYRKDLVKAIIESYPAGAPISTNEFRRVLGFKPQTSGTTTVIGRLIGNGEISRRRIGKRNSGLNIYKVLVPGNAYDRERELHKEQSPEKLIQAGYVNPGAAYAQRVRRAKEAELLNEINISQKTEWSFEELEERAMRFAFYESDSLVLFIKSLKKGG